MGFILGQQSTEEGFQVGAESPLSQSVSFCSEQFSGVPAQISVRVEPTKGTDEDVSVIYINKLFIERIRIMGGVI